MSNIYKIILKSALLTVLLGIGFTYHIYASESDFESTWSTNWGEMKLKQEGSKVTGTYTHDSGKIDAVVSGNSLKGKWSESPTYKEPGDAGDVELKMGNDGKSFAGLWRYGSTGEWNGGWTGTRVSGDLKLNTPDNPQANNPTIAPTQSAPQAPQANQTLIFDTTPKYIGACSLTDKAEWALDKDLNVTMVQFWFNWKAGETTLDFTITKDGQEFLKGIAKRTNCDTYQNNWCNADYVTDKTFTQGKYSSKISSTRQCLKPGGTGTVRLYGMENQVQNITPSAEAKPTSAPNPVSLPPTNTQTWFSTKCQGQVSSIYVEDRIVQNGAKASIPVIVCNAKDLANMDFEVGYNPSVLSFISTDKGSLNSSSMLQSNPKDGRVKVSYAQNNGSSGNGSVAYVNFNVMGQEGTTSQLSPIVNSAKDVSGKDIKMAPSSGNFTVGQGVKGDCDGDGIVSSRDALAALQMAVEKIDVNLCFDLNSDGKVDSTDAREILKKAVGK